jgi:hypothetical protein
MAFTWIGLVIVLIGALLLIRSSAVSMFSFVLFMSLLGGSAAIVLPALGGSSIPPTYLALGFLAARILLPGSGTVSLVGPALRDNMALAVFCLYGAITAFLLPRLFADALNVTPMHSSDLRHIFDTRPLGFSSQNITTAVYMIGALLGAVLAAAAARTREAAPRILAAFAWLTWAHVALGLIATALTAAGQQGIIDVFRNGSYAQLDQQYQGFIRISGLFPEASSYAAHGVVLLILMAEAWLRDLRPRLTGPAALAMALTLVFSTSSSAYVGLAGYAVILLGRGLLLPGSVPGGKVLTLALFGFITVLAGVLAAVASPSLLAQLVDMIQHMTVDKADSHSGLQRGFWARQGIDAFQVSYGLGVGAGSFRSSSILTAIAGSMGVIGLVSFAAAIWATLKPLRASTYGGAQVPRDQAIGACCGWAAVIGLLPAMVASPSPDPGLLFGLLAGLAVALRAVPVAAIARPAPIARTYQTPHANSEGAT